MNAQELHNAINQAWQHTQQTAPGPDLEMARSQLAALREAQRRMAEKSVASDHSFDPQYDPFPKIGG